MRITKILNPPTQHMVQTVFKAAYPHINYVNKAYLLGVSSRGMPILASTESLTNQDHFVLAKVFVYELMERMNCNDNLQAQEHFLNFFAQEMRTHLVRVEKVKRETIDRQNLDKAGRLSKSIMARIIKEDG